MRSGFVPSAIRFLRLLAKADSDSEVVAAEGVAEPKKLRYLYSSPWFGSLYSDACLPLGAFHIGD